MPSKLDPALRARLDELARTDPDQLVPLIVTLTPGADASTLRAKGLRIEQQFPIISAVAGRMTARQALDLAALDDVVRVEYDGEMRAL